MNEQKLEYNRKYRKEHAEEIRGYHHKYIEKNKDVCIERSRKWQEQNREKQQEYMRKSREKNREMARQKDRERYAANKDKHREYFRLHREERIAKSTQYKKSDKYRAYARKYMDKRLQDPIRRMVHNLRSRLKSVLKVQCATKVSTTMKLVGCSPSELKLHVESQFTEGMSWDNYGKWHIDHITPCASFDMNDPAQQRLCCHYTNLQPMWARENIVKSDNV